MNSFENFTIEDIHQCAGDEFPGGIRSRIYYAPAEFFQNIHFSDDSISITAQDIEMKENCNWRSFDCLVDENEVKNLFTGPKARMKMKSQLDIFILGFSEKISLFLYRLINTPLIFAIPDANGKVWIFGNLRNRAFFEKAEGTSGKKYDENPGYSATLSASTPLLKFLGDIYALLGDFNNDFNEDFSI